MSVLNPCDKDVFKWGTVLCIFEGTSEEAEEFCKERTKHTGHKHDWHIFAGRKVVKYLATEPDPVQLSRAEYEELQHTKKLYDELLYNVASKYENETRHQTALRYIRHAEEPKNENCAESEGEKHE